MRALEELHLFALQLHFISSGVAARFYHSQPSLTILNFSDIRTLCVPTVTPVLPPPNSKKKKSHQPWLLVEPLFSQRFKPSYRHYCSVKPDNIKN